MSEKIGETLRRLAAATVRGNSETSGTTEPAGDRLGDPQCPHCGGLGYIRADRPLGHPEFGRVQLCSCREGEVLARAQRRLYSLSRLEDLRDLTFETFKPQGRVGIGPHEGRSLEEAYQRSRHYADRPTGWLLLQGGYGVGKTHLAAAVANQAVSAGVPTLFLTVPDLLDALRAGYSAEDATFEERFEQVRAARLLVLDDFGTQNATEWAREKLFQILNYRYINRLPSLITTNLALEQIEPRIRSRLSDPELVDRVYIQAPDFRRPLVDTSQPALSSLDQHRHQTFGSFTFRQDEKLPAEQVRSLEEAFKAAQQFAEARSGWLLLGGGYGSGKTHLAAAAANYAAGEGSPALFVMVPDLLDHLRATFNPNSAVSYDRRFEEIRNAELLVLDDLGTQATTPWAREKLYQLFTHRYVGRLPTVITSAELPEQMDAKLRAQLDDRRLCVRKLITAPSYRGRPAR